jgi:hypothetical protein
LYAVGDQYALPIPFVCNPVRLLAHFSELGHASRYFPLSALPHYEGVTLAVWGAAALCLAAVCFFRFRRTSL